MADKIRVGIVGATVTTGGSGWGANAHVPALAILPEYELKAVCTAHEDTAKASAEKFGAELAFHDINAMAAHPDVDLIAVVVRVPGHKDLVMAGLQAGKPVFCEWPLGANLKEAQEMADYANSRSLRTIVGLQARSDPTLMYARDLIAQGYIGEVLSANLSVMTQAVIDRGPGRIWQGVRANGANTMTIAGGHAIDALCFILGEFTEVQARVATKIKNWRHEDTKADFPVDSPDTVTAAGVLQSGAEVAFQVAAVPHAPERQSTRDLRSRGQLCDFRRLAEHRPEPPALRQGPRSPDRDAAARQVRPDAGRHARPARRATSRRPGCASPTLCRATTPSTPTSTSQCNAIVCSTPWSAPRTKAKRYRSSEQAKANRQTGKERDCC